MKGSFRITKAIAAIWVSSALFVGACSASPYTESSPIQTPTTIDRVPAKPPPLINPLGPSASRVARTTVLPLAEAGSIASFTFADPDHGWIAKGRAILATSDGGKTWQRQHEADSQVNYVDFVSTEQGWAASENGLLRTRDGGDSWQRAGTGDIFSLIRVDFVDVSNGWAWADSVDEFVKTADGGRTWKGIANPCPRAGLGRPIFSFTTPATGWVACGGVAGGTFQGKQLFKTEDGGLHWKLVAQAQFSERTPASGGVLPLGGHLADLFFLDGIHGWMSTSRGGLYVTIDAGRSWEWVPVGRRIGLEDEEFVGAARFLSPRQGYAISSLREGILAGTKDGGDTWTPLYPPATPIGPLAFFDAQNGVGAGTSLDPGAILSTADGGRNWSQIASLKHRTIVTLDFPDPRRGWALTSGGALYGSADGGLTWMLLQGLRRPSTAYTSMSFLDGQAGYLVSQHGDLFATDDGAITIEKVISFDDHSISLSPRQALQFVGDRIGWVLADQQLFATDDGGSSWTRLRLGYRIQDFCLLPDGRAWAVVSDYTLPADETMLLSTLDGGKSWTRYDLGSVVPGSVSFSDAAHGWLSDGHHWLYRTEDGGATWVQLR